LLAFHATFTNVTKSTFADFDTIRQLSIHDLPQSCEVSVTKTSVPSVYAIVIVLRQQKNRWFGVQPQTVQIAYSIRYAMFRSVLQNCTKFALE
jgi:hypothetical protein